MKFKMFTLNRVNDPILALFSTGAPLRASLFNRYSEYEATAYVNLFANMWGTVMPDHLQANETLTYFIIEQTSQFNQPISGLGG